MLTSDFYTQNAREVRVFGSADNGTPSSSPASHTFDVEAGEEEDKYIVQISADEDLRSKEVSALSSDPQKYERSEIWLTIFLVDEMTTLLHAFSQKHAEELMKSPKSIKYQCGVSLMSVGSSVHGRLGAVEIHSVLGEQRTHFFINIVFALAIVDGRHRHFCTQKLRDSGQPGTECALWPILMTLIEALGSLLAIHKS